MTTTIDLAEMRTFVAVVTEGSFTAAARRLDTDKARISRAVRRMEEKLGAQLLNRSTRRLSVTEVGRDYFERAACILSAAEAAAAAVAQRTQQPKGRLKITAGAEFGNTRVDGWIAEFLKTAPAVTVEAEYTNRLVDIIHEGVDVAIRIGDLPDSELSARRLGEVRYGLYASPDYLRRSAPLREITDLAHHDLVMHAPRGRPRWTLINGLRTERIEQIPRCTLNNTIAARNMALAGLGIVQLPQYMVEPYVADNTLTRVLPDWARMPASYTPSSLRAATWIPRCAASSTWRLHVFLTKLVSNSHGHELVGCGYRARQPVTYRLRVSGLLMGGRLRVGGNAKSTTANSRHLPEVSCDDEGQLSYARLLKTAGPESAPFSSSISPTATRPMPAEEMTLTAS